jgi:hypothetical protein
VLRSLTTLPHDLGGGMSFYGLQQHFWDLGVLPKRREQLSAA